MSVKSILNLYVLNVARENITKRFYDVTLPLIHPCYYEACTTASDTMAPSEK